MLYWKVRMTWCLRNEKLHLPGLGEQQSRRRDCERYSEARAECGYLEVAKTTGLGAVNEGGRLARKEAREAGVAPHRRRAVAHAGAAGMGEHAVEGSDGEEDRA